MVPKMLKIESQQTDTVCELQTTKYPLNVMKAVRISLDIKPNSTELDSQINDMSKVEVMDRYLASSDDELTGTEIREVIDNIYRISLDTISANGEGSLLALYPLDIMERVRETQKVDPASTEIDLQIMSMTKVEVMDKFLYSYGKKITGSEIRRIVNGIFGVNLNGIATLDNARLSIFSKGQWIIQNDTDILLVSSGRGDIDVKVSAAPYFIEKTDSDPFPNELHNLLTKLEFSYNEEMKAFNYSNPTGLSISDSFKGDLIGPLVTCIKEHY
jgi:hypothetical protein